MQYEKSRNGGKYVLILLGEGRKRKEQDTQGDWVKVDNHHSENFMGK